MRNLLPSPCVFSYCKYILFKLDSKCKELLLSRILNKTFVTALYILTFLELKLKLRFTESIVYQNFLMLFRNNVFINTKSNFIIFLCLKYYACVFFELSILFFKMGYTFVIFLKLNIFIHH